MAYLALFPAHCNPARFCPRKKVQKQCKCNGKTRKYQIKFMPSIANGCREAYAANTGKPRFTALQLDSRPGNGPIGPKTLPRVHTECAQGRFCGFAAGEGVGPVADRVIKCFQSGILGVFCWRRSRRDPPIRQKWPKMPGGGTGHRKPVARGWSRLYQCRGKTTNGCREGSRCFCYDTNGGAKVQPKA